MRKIYKGWVDAYFKIEADDHEGVYEQIGKDLSGWCYDIHKIDIEDEEDVEPEDNYGN